MNHQCIVSAWCSTTLPPRQSATSWALKLVTCQRVDCKERRNKLERKTRGLGVTENGFEKDTYRIWAPGGLATADAEERGETERAGASESD